MKKIFDKTSKQHRFTLACLDLNNNAFAMTWNRQKSQIESLVIEILKLKTSLSLVQLVEEIQLRDKNLLSGKTPKNSLYSIIIRREQKRIDCGGLPFFKVNRVGRNNFYSLNKEVKL